MRALKFGSAAIGLAVSLSGQVVAPPAAPGTNGESYISSEAVRRAVRQFADSNALGPNILLRGRSNDQTPLDFVDRTNPLAPGKCVVPLLKAPLGNTREFRMPVDRPPKTEPMPEAALTPVCPSR